MAHDQSGSANPSEKEFEAGERAGRKRLGEDGYPQARPVPATAARQGSACRLAAFYRFARPEVVERPSHDDSLCMPDKLNALLERLKAHQRDLIFAMAEHDILPAGSALRQVAELENVIAAVEATVDEEADRARRDG